MARGRALVALLLALAVPGSAWAACGSALLQPAARSMCLMMQGGHCENDTGLSPDCCKTDHETPRNQVLTTVTVVPGKAALEIAPAPAPAVQAVPTASARAFETASRGPTKLPLDAVYLRHAALLI
jgi:hypothetical protein